MDAKEIDYIPLIIHSSENSRISNVKIVQSSATVHQCSRYLSIRNLRDLVVIISDDFYGLEDFLDPGRRLAKATIASRERPLLDSLTTGCTMNLPADSLFRLWSRCGHQGIEYPHA